MGLLFLCVPHLLSAQDVLLQQKTARLYNTGVELMTLNQYASARENFNQYLSLVANNSTQRQDAEYYRAVCSLNLYHSDAEKQVQDFIDHHPSSPKALMAYHELANFFYTEKNYKKAAQYFSKTDFSALSLGRQNTAHFRWGYSLFSQRQLKEALDQFNFIKTQGGAYGPAASYYAGFVEYGLTDYANALTDLKRAEQAEAYAGIVPYLIANVYYKQKDYNALIDYAQSVSTKNNLTNADEIALLSAEASFKKSDFKSALAGYDKYLEGKEEKASKNILYRAGYAAYASGQNAKAVSYLKNSFSDTDSVGYYSAFYLGMLYLKTNQKSLALTSFDVARRYKGDPALAEEAAFQFAKISYDVGRPDQAITEFERILKNYPAGEHTTEIKELLSQAYVNANNFNRAIEYIEALPSRTAAVERAYQKATMLKGMDLFNKDDYPLAVQFFEKSLAYPEDKKYVAEASLWCGEAYSAGRRYEDAVKYYLKAIEEDEGGNVKLKARYGLGYAYFNLQQYDRALFSFKEFVNKSPNGQPNLADGTLRLADCYYISKSYNDALSFYRKAVGLNSSDVDYAHFQSGIILGILQKYSEAKTELGRVIRDYPNSRFNDEAIFQLAQQEFGQGHYAEAVSGYTNLITSNPSSRFVPYAYVRRAAANYNLKDYSKTSDDYITAIEKYGNHPATKDVLLSLQESLNLTGRSAEFSKYLSEYKKANPDAKGVESVEFEAAKNLYFNQDYVNAIKNLDAFIASYPQSTKLTEAKYYQAESYYRTKDFTKALAIYNEISMDKTYAMATKVTARIAELEFRQGHYQSAVPFYQTLAQQAANKKEQYTAWNGLMESYYLLAKYDSSEKYAQVILQSGSVSAGAQNKAALFLGKIAMGKGDYETAKDEFLTTINAAQDEYGAEAKYHLAEIFFLNKDYPQCNETLFGLNTDFSSYTEWVGRSYLLLADSYLKTDNTYQAKATLISLVDNFPVDEIKKQASEKLKQIDAAQLKNKQNVQRDSTKN
ncbi:MAG: tetratricopeptide repeat protein [Bacteroidetes bacterium]|nr:tetratricopeptide repeat protein [Bacteroidota bacterium]